MGTENKYYRWVKASERLPDTGDYVPARLYGYDYSRSLRLEGFKEEDGTIIGNWWDVLDNGYTDHTQIEWLEEVSLPAPPSEEEIENASYDYMLSQWGSRLEEFHFEAQCSKEGFAAGYKAAIEKLNSDMQPNGASQGTLNKEQNHD